MTLRNALLILVFPALMFGAGLIVMTLQPRVPWSLSAVVVLAPYLLALFAAIAGGWFKCPRVVLMAALIAGAHWVVQAFVAGTPIYDREPELTIIYAAVAVLFPINAALIAVKADRGLLSLGVLSRVLFVGLQVAALVVVWDAGESARAFADDLLHVRVFDKDLDYWSLLPQPALFLFAAVSVGLLGRAVLKGGVLDGGLFGAVAVSALALHAAANGAVSSMLFILAGIVLLAAVAQESYRLAFIDELTGLPGRRALMHDLTALSGTYTVAMLDVDHFKKFNDTYGHDVGDQVLKMVAAQMMRVSGGGRAFRYGGEEFTVLFARKELEDAIPHLDKLRKSIAAASFKLRAEDRPKHKPSDLKTKSPPRKSAAAKDIVSVTISIGAAARTDGQTPQDALKSADEALYRAKDAGRNRVSK
ncbi:GGDEF domain-containing protein [Magnetovibrio sp.]|uniref:GGDEF domain-containing protein n=1 Tax=Magnetovibrio sp. TaxID=2024836 RepID=UPI002F92F59D